VTPDRVDDHRHSHSPSLPGGGLLSSWGPCATLGVGPPLCDHDCRMKFDRAGYPFIAGTLVPAALLLARRRTGLGLPLLGVAGFMAFFFRDPERYPPQHPDVVVSPADGQVVFAGRAEPGVAPPGE